MEFITTGNRIAVENFDIGKIYTITWQTGNYKSLACTGKGTDFVMFQDQEPELLFCLNMDSAITVSSIEEGGGGSGTSNYNELDNKPQINGVTLVGNKSSADLNIYDVPAVTSENNNYILTASFSGGVGSYSWQPAQGGGGTSDYTQLSNLPQINSVELIGNKSLSDLGIASAAALAGKQDVISDLSTIRSGAAAGATAVQPATLDSYQPLINDLSTIRSGAAAGATAVQPATLAGYQTLIDSSHKLSSDLVDDTGHTNKFATAAQLAQIETNKNNILLNTSNGVKNVLCIERDVVYALNSSLSWNGNTCSYSGVDYTFENGVITVNTPTAATATSYIYLSQTVDKYCNGQYILSGHSGNVRIYAAKGNYFKEDDGNGVVLTTTSETGVGAIIRVDSGETVNNLVITPMIRPITTDSAFEKYAPSNRELYEMILAL